MAMHKPMGGLKGLLIMAKKKPSVTEEDSGDDEAPESEPEPVAGSEDIQLKRAFRAAQNGDEAAFIKAVKSAIETCVENAKDY